MSVHRADLVAQLKEWFAEEEDLYRVANETDDQDDWDAADQFWEETIQDLKSLVGWKS